MNQATTENSVALVKTKAYDLLIPNILLYLDFLSLVKLRELNKIYHRTIDDESKAIGYWPAVCNSFCYYSGLFSTIIYNPELIQPINYRKHFFDDLWPLRNKWSLATANAGPQVYKVRVACRFRPGETPDGRVCLPLHQFLKLKRQQKLKNEAETMKGPVASSCELLVGEKEPEEFLDPFLGTLMKDPVLLKPSNRICDRSVALQCILRGGRDPFNNRKLSQDMLQPLPELAKRIQEWKVAAEKKKDITVDIKDTKGLVDSMTYNNDLLEALLEIENIHRQMKKLKEQEFYSEQGDGFTADNPAALINNVPEVNGIGNNDANDGLFPEEEAAVFVEEEQENVLPNFFGPIGSVNLLQDANHPNRNSPSTGKKTEVARVSDINQQQGFVSMHIPGVGVRPFHYSQVYNPQVKQIQIYESSLKESIIAALNGCNACIMCYGQTGSGKTYTFLGPEGCLDEIMSDDLQTIFTHYPNLGLVLRATDDLFFAQSIMKKYQVNMNIGIQMVEVYEEKTTDLLTGRTVTVRRDTGAVNGPIHPLFSQADFLTYLKTAHNNQRYAETAMNQRSSRAHTIFIFHITQQLVKQDATISAEPILLQSQLHLVDLAGSERVKKSRVTGVHLREAVGINTSLLVLGKVISALVKAKSHVPYLESRLTTILKSAFGGNARTTVIINTRMEEIHGDETLQTLRFGERCAMISNSLKQLASSYEETLSVLEHSLAVVAKQLQSFQQKQKTHLPAYQTLVDSHSNLLRKREELLLFQNEQAMKSH